MAFKKFTRRVKDTSKIFGMEISAEKSKVMVVGKKENIDGQVVNVTVDGKRLEQVKNFNLSRINFSGGWEVRERNSN